jgi:LacI family transcriptional regulator
MSYSPVTIRSLARALELSPATVSDALRGTGRVGPETAARVRRAATAAGYRLNPLTTALMSDLRRSRATTFRGVLAAVEINEPDRGSHGPFPRHIVIGARERAKALGFELEEFRIGDGGLTLKRLNSVMSSRGINGVMLLPAWYAPDLSSLDWSRFAGVYTDCVINRPHLHSVCTDHYRSMIELLSLLHSRGYRRPGLTLESGRDERLQLRHTAAFRAFQESHAEVEPVPVMIVPQFTEQEFGKWYKRHRPDVVLSHNEQMVRWIERLGHGVPETCGFVHLNTLAQKFPCAGLDLQPQQLGARAAELLVGQVHQRETGTPAWPSSTMLVARWVEGETIRPASGAES